MFIFAPIASLAVSDRAIKLHIWAADVAHALVRAASAHMPTHGPQAAEASRRVSTRHARVRAPRFDCNAKLLLRGPLVGRRRVSQQSSTNSFTRVSFLTAVCVYESKRSST
jgi:hypothetical protein